MLARRAPFRPHANGQVFAEATQLGYSGFTRVSPGQPEAQTLAKPHYQLGQPGHSRAPNGMSARPAPCWRLLCLVAAGNATDLRDPWPVLVPGVALSGLYLVLKIREFLGRPAGTVPSCCDLSRAAGVTPSSIRPGGCH